MKNKPINDGSFNKKWTQPPERNPIDEMLKKMKERADKVNDLFDVLMEAIKNLSRGNFTTPMPVMFGPACLYTHQSCNPQEI